MNASAENTPAPPARHPAWRIPVLILCLSAAFGAAWLGKESENDSPGNPAAAAATPQDAAPGEILSALPPPAADTATGKAMSAAIRKLRQTPGEAAAWVSLGDSLAQQLRDSADEKYYHHAESAYRCALKLKPGFEDALTGMAWVEGGRHRFDKSIAWANQALAVNADSIAAQGILGDAALELGEYDKAFDHYQKMMDLRPDLSSWSRGAHLLWITGDKSKAIWLMEKAIKAGAPFAENTAWCRAKLAMMLFNDGALLPAAQVLEPALAADSRNAHVLLAAGRIAAAKGDLEGAMKHCRKMLENGPHHDALAALGDLHHIRGEQAEAEKCYAEVEALHAAHLASGAHDHMSMAKFYADHDRNLVEALRLAEQHKLTRNVTEADVLAWVYFKNGDQPRAIEAMKRALEKKTPDAEMHFHAGMIAAGGGDRVAALKHLQQALSFNPQFNPLLAPVAVKTIDELSSVRPVLAEPAAQGGSQ